jgi:hypothetical protein
VKGVSWIVRPCERKQILMVKVPSTIVRQARIEDGMHVTVRIRAGSSDIFLGPLNVTSDHELYIPKRVQDLLGNFREVMFQIEGGTPVER